MSGYYRDANTSFPIENVFNISKPLFHECCVTSYSTLLSRLDVRVIRKSKELPSEEIIFLSFNAVAYYEGPMSWNGANFSVAPPNECVAVARKIALYKSAPDEDITNYYALFVINNSEVSVKILAGLGRKLPLENYQ